MTEEEKIRFLKQINAIKKEYILRIKHLEDKFNLIIKSKDEQIKNYKEEIKELREIIKLQARRPIYFLNETKAISNSKTIQESIDESRNIKITGGVVNASGAGAFNLGDISGIVANTINQLPASDSEQLGIKELLSQLQEAIETSTDLDDEDKGDALEEVQNLAEASQDNDEDGKKTKAGKSLRMLGRIAKGLPTAAAFVTISQTVLPKIAKFFGL